MLRTVYFMDNVASIAQLNIGYVNDKVNKIHTI